MPRAFSEDARSGSMSVRDRLKGSFEERLGLFDDQHLATIGKEATQGRDGQGVKDCQTTDAQSVARRLAQDVAQLARGESGRDPAKLSGPRRPQIGRVLRPGGELGKPFV